MKLKCAEEQFEKALALPSNPNDSKRRIAEIAMEAGFSDISHLPALSRAGSETLPGVSSGGEAHVRFGSKADISTCSSDVRLTPKSGH